MSIVSDLDPRSFEPGQPLSAADLTDVQLRLQRARRLHNQTLHGSGVASGLQVSANEGDATTVAVSEGYALDPDGRELVLQAVLDVKLPQQSGGAGAPETSWVLAIAHAEAQAWKACCQPVDSGSGEARLAWCTSTATLPAGALALGSVVIKNRRLVQPPADRRHLLNASVQPRLAAGRAENLEWAWWPSPDDPRGVEAAVLTESARFGDPPCYMVTLLGSRLGTVHSDGKPVMWMGFGRVIDSSNDGFTYRVELPAGLSSEDVEINPPPATPGEPIPGCIQGWSLMWLGVGV